MLSIPHFRIHVHASTHEDTPSFLSIPHFRIPATLRIRIKKYSLSIPHFRILDYQVDVWGLQYIFQFLILGYIVKPSTSNKKAIFQFLILGYRAFSYIWTGLQQFFQFLILGYDVSGKRLFGGLLFQFLILGYLISAANAVEFNQPFNSSF